MRNTDQIHNTKEDIFNILRLLSSGENLSQRDVSMHLGFSLGKTNYLLKSLMRKDLIKIKNLIFGDNKAKKIKYFLTKKGLKEKINLTYHFLQIKEIEYNFIKSEWNALADHEHN
ncbi:MAG: MarR family EPS-associated transcriptional regulator, partial [Candidatus Omnitrophica bacterium]|nr:MarR family EPS-associated transcriptional regulator [Candidatus Omnitrophota bacterium]